VTNRALLFAGLAAIVVGLAGFGVVAGQAAGMMGTADMMSGSGMMSGGGMMAGGGMTEQPMMVWQRGDGPLASPQSAAASALRAVRAKGWSWLSVDEVHIFPSFYEVEFNDRDGYKGPEVYVNRNSGAVGPEMGPNMMWDSTYGMGGACSATLPEAQARQSARSGTSLALGDAERHHGYWEFELKRGDRVVNQINVQDCTHQIIDEQMWQPDMGGTSAGA
jgi:hypothetical protein